MTRRRFPYTTSTPVCFLGGHPRDPRDLFVLCCGYDKCSPEYQVDRRNHRLFVMEYVLRGEGEFAAGGKRWRLHGGMVFYYGPGTPHSYRTDPSNPMEKVWVVYSGSEAEKVTAAISGLPFGAHRLESPAQVFTLMDAICTEIINKSFNSQQICDCLLRALLASIAQLRLQEPSKRTEPLQAYHRCKSHMDTHFSNMRSPFEVCADLHVSPSYLCRLFKRFSTSSPAGYLSGLKLESAAYTLVSSSLSIKEIAASLGFSDQYNFSRAFRRRFGVSPTAYRQPPLIAEASQS